MEALLWKCLQFKELSNDQLYAILALRCEVFIVEQNCPYQDIDGKDQSAYHMMGFDTNGLLVAYSRILPPGISYAESSIGRVVSSGKIRRSGGGRELMEKTLSYMKKELQYVAVRISAQEYLERFYKSFGFETVTEPYLEDNIPHIQMLMEF